MYKTSKLRRELKIHSELSPTNDIPLGAIARLLDKPDNPFYPDYDYAELRILPAGTLNAYRTLEVVLVY